MSTLPHVTDRAGWKRIINGLKDNPFKSLGAIFQLNQWLDDKDPQVQTAAAEGATQNGLIPHLIPFLASPDRRVVGYALGSIFLMVSHVRQSKATLVAQLSTPDVIDKLMKSFLNYPHTDDPVGKDGGVFSTRNFAQWTIFIINQCSQPANMHSLNANSAWVKAGLLETDILIKAFDLYPTSDNNHTNSFDKVYTLLNTILWTLPTLANVAKAMNLKFIVKLMKPLLKLLDQTTETYIMNTIKAILDGALRWIVKYQHTIRPESWPCEEPILGEADIIKKGRGSKQKKPAAGVAPTKSAPRLSKKELAKQRQKQQQKDKLQQKQQQQKGEVGGDQQQQGEHINNSTGQNAHQNGQNDDSGVGANAEHNDQGHAINDNDQSSLELLAQRGDNDLPPIERFLNQPNLISSLINFPLDQPEGPRKPNIGINVLMILLEALDNKEKQVEWGQKMIDQGLGKQFDHCLSRNFLTKNKPNPTKPLPALTQIPLSYQSLPASAITDTDLDRLLVLDDSPTAAELIDRAITIESYRDVGKNLVQSSIKFLAFFTSDDHFLRWPQVVDLLYFLYITTTSNNDKQCAEILNLLSKIVQWITPRVKEIDVLQLFNQIIGIVVDTTKEIDCNNCKYPITVLIEQLEESRWLSTFAQTISTSTSPHIISALSQCLVSIHANQVALSSYPRTKIDKKTAETVFLTIGGWVSDWHAAFATILTANYMDNMAFKMVKSGISPYEFIRFYKTFCDTQLALAEFEKQSRMEIRVTETIQGMGEEIGEVTTLTTTTTPTTRDPSSSNQPILLDWKYNPHWAPPGMASLLGARGNVASSTTTSSKTTTTPQQQRAGDKNNIARDSTGAIIGKKKKLPPPLKKPDGNNPAMPRTTDTTSTESSKSQSK